MFNWSLFSQFTQPRINVHIIMIIAAFIEVQTPKFMKALFVWT